MKQNIAEVLGKRAGEATANRLDPAQAAALIVVFLLLAYLLTDKRAIDNIHNALFESHVPKPLHLTTFLLCLFLSATDRDNMIGDLNERFPKWAERHGVIIAHVVYVIEAFTMIYPAALKLLAKTVEFVGIERIIRHIRFW